MNPIWRVTMEMSKSRSENQKQNKKRREIQRDKTRKEKEKRRLEALERDRQRFIVGQEQNTDELERDEDLQESAAEKFQKELCWCIQQTKLGLASIKPSSKEAKPQDEEAQKVLRILTSPKAPMAKKRQVMRATFGDYRSKMQQEERRHKADMSRRMHLEAAGQVKQDSSTFYRMSSASASMVPSAGILSTSNDLPGESTGHDPGSTCHDKGHAGKEWSQNEEVDKSMQELEQSTKSLHILNTETNNKMVQSNTNDACCGKSDEMEQQTCNENVENERKHSEELSNKGDLSLNPSNEHQPFLFNFDICKTDLDRVGNGQMLGSNKNIDTGSYSENSTPEKGPGGGRKKQGSRRRNRAKKKLAMRDKEASVTADNQKLCRLEADGEFRFNFPDPTIQQSAAATAKP